MNALKLLIVFILTFFLTANVYAEAQTPHVQVVQLTAFNKGVVAYMNITRRCRVMFGRRNQISSKILVNERNSVNLLVAAFLAGKRVSFYLGNGYCKDGMFTSTKISVRQN